METLEFTYHLDSINTIAEEVLDKLESKIILFNGDMGSGKTTFINALLNAMGSNDNVSSPTFSIVNEYESQKGKVFHFDFYRIKSLEEAYNFGIEDYLASDAWLFIEWPERIEEVLPANTQTITISEIEENKRSLKLTINNKKLTNIML